ncbi:MAG: nitroimidazol reductase NimA-like FMN-containing flavoprotein [Acidimicrobiales bacterium]
MRDLWPWAEKTAPAAIEPMTASNQHLASDRSDGMEHLTEDECWQLLGTKRVGRLAVSIANSPDIFPVNFRLEDETIVVKTAAGLKLAAATLGPAVAFEVDDLEEMRHSGWSVVVRGPAEEIVLSDEVLAAERLLVEPWADGERNRLFRISPLHVSGRRIRPTIAASTER